MKTNEAFGMRSVKHFLNSISCVAKSVKDETGIFCETANNIRIILDYCSRLENEIAELKGNKINPEAMEDVFKNEIHKVF